MAVNFQVKRRTQHKCNALYKVRCKALHTVISMFCGGIQLSTRIFYHLPQYIFTISSSVDYDYHSDKLFTMRSLVTTSSQDYKTYNLCFSLMPLVVFFQRVQTTLTDFLSTFPQLVLHQSLLIYSHFVSCLILCGNISILTFSFLPLSPFSLVPLKSNIHYHRMWSLGLK